MSCPFLSSCSGCPRDSQNIPIPKVQGTMQKMGWKTVKSWRSRGVPMRRSVSPSDIRSYAHKASPTRLCKHELNKSDNSRHARVRVGETTGLNPKELQAAKAGREKEKQSSPGQSTPTGYPMYWKHMPTSNLLQAKHGVFVYLGMCVCINVYTATINEKKAWRSRRGIQGVPEGGKGRRKLFKLIIISTK